jgi:amino acid transporter
MNILALLISLILAALGIWQIKDSKSTSLISVMACLSITIAIMSLLAVIFPVNDHVRHDREFLSCDRNLNSVTVKQREIYRDLESNTNDERIFLECEPSPLE